LTDMAEGTVFLETVVARDGSVSSVSVLGGNGGGAAPLVEALRRERYWPGRRNGRPVAVSVYRLISRVDVYPPLT
jgi:Gram-negative bacterial TonB protein C-terminal